ncbi:P-loop NTPase fold protein [Nonomuraea sp. NPDC048826]|uniref:P-loop NTPase fold protein n=1 Tax=Nonomuraea sp. NPDC048826 TaxID=3364347 RepID=UPI0037247B31
MSVPMSGDFGPAPGVLAVWPPPTVLHVSPARFGIRGAKDMVNPYVARDVDAELDACLRRDRAFVVTAPLGAGATRTVYESLKRVLPHLPLLVAGRPGEFDPKGLPDLHGDGPGVLWIKNIGAHWGVLGDRLLDVLEEWLVSPHRYVVATWRPSQPDLPKTKEFAALGIPVVTLDDELTGAEQKAMRQAYGTAGITRSIGRNPPRRSSFSRSVRAVMDALTPDAPVTSGALAEAIRRQHPEYAGGLLTRLPDEGASRTPVEWLAAVESCYPAREVARSRHQVIDSRLVLRALIELDPALRQAVGEAAVKRLDAEIEVAPRAPEPRRREHVRWLTDEPVGTEHDELRRHGVATALEEQLRSVLEDFPGRSFLVHLDGPWGAGKSTLLRFLRESVAAKPDPWLIVEYDAWRQSRGGPPWLTLLQAFRAALRGARRGPARWWFLVCERARLVDRWLWPAVAVTAAVVVAVTTGAMLAEGRPTLATWGDLAKILGGLVPAVGGLWLLAKAAGRFFSLDSRRSARTFVETRADPMEDLAEHFDWLLRRAGRPVLLLVDDLDRCEGEFVVALLDAVQKLMRDRMATEGSHSLMVVVAADGRWVRAGYDQAYASLSRSVDRPGATVGSLFLEKLFQLTVPVPRLPAELQLSYLANLLSEADRRPAGPTDLKDRLGAAEPHEVLGILAGAPVADRIEAAEVAIARMVTADDAVLETEHILQPYAGLLDRTPRSMKRFVMAYSMLRAVRLAEGNVVGPGPLALWTVLLTRWPLLADYLQTWPEAVRLFSVPAERMPPSVPEELVPLFTDPPDGLRAVMNHPDGPLDERRIRACSGQAIS